MKETIRRLASDDFDEVREIFIDSFFDSEYFIELFPSPDTRLEMFDKHIMPLCRYCLERERSYCAVADGVIAGYMLIADYSAKNAEEVDEVFFDPAIRHGDEQKHPFKEAVQRAFVEHGPVTLFLIGALSKKFKKLGIAERLLTYCMERHKDKPIVTGLTTPEIISILNNLPSGRKLTEKKLSEFHTITTVLPK